MTERVQIRSLSFRQTEDAARRIHRRSFANKAFFMSKLLFGFLTIILLGALVFHAAESNTRKKEIEENIKKRKEVMQILGNNETLFKYIIDRMDGLHRGHEKNHWNISGSFFFAFTVATTIGYGDYAPKTPWGRAFFCVYGVVAIPVAGIILVKFANQVLKFFTYLYTIRKDRARKAFKVLDQSGTGFLNRSQFRQSLEELSVDMTDDEYSKLLKKLLDKHDNPDRLGLEQFKKAVKILKVDLLEISGRSSQIKVVTMCLLAWLVIGSAMFDWLSNDEGHIKNLDFGTAFYFAFATLSTIGLGDITPPDGADRYFLYIYVLVGLGLLGVFVNLVSIIAELSRDAARQAIQSAKIAAIKKKKQFSVARQSSASKSKKLRAMTRPSLACISEKEEKAIAKVVDNVV